MEEFQNSILFKSLKLIRNVGILITILGLIAIIYPNGFGKVTSVTIAILLIVGGVFRFWIAIFSPTVGSLLSKYLYALLITLAGFWMMFNTDSSMQILTIVLGVYFILDGLTALFYSFSLRPLGGGMHFLINGLLGLVIGILILLEWPESSLYVIGIYIGTKLLGDGIALWLTGQNLMSREKLNGKSN